MAINPASVSFSKQGPEIPVQPTDNLAILALGTLASGLQGYQTAKNDAIERDVKLLMALGPTLASQGQISMSPSRVPGPGGWMNSQPLNPGSRLPIYAGSGFGATTAGDLRRADPDSVPFSMIDKWAKANKVDRPMSDAEFAGQLAQAQEIYRQSVDSGAPTNIKLEKHSGKLTANVSDPSMLEFAGNRFGKANGNGKGAPPSPQRLSTTETSQLLGSLKQFGSKAKLRSAIMQKNISPERKKAYLDYLDSLKE